MIQMGMDDFKGLSWLGLTLGSLWRRSSLSDVLVFLSLFSPQFQPVPSLQPSGRCPPVAPPHPVKEDIMVGPECVISLRGTCILREELDESFANSQVKMINNSTFSIWRRIFAGAWSYLHFFKKPKKRDVQAVLFLNQQVASVGIYSIRRGGLVSGEQFHTSRAGI